jgi:type IV secretory pathway VirB2 component (pilin)
MKYFLKSLKQYGGFPALLLLGSVAASANQGNGGNALPWDQPLTTLVQSLQGPVAFAIAVVGIIACGAMLIFGGEMSDTMKRLLQVGIACCLIVFSTQVLSTFIGFGEEIPATAAVHSSHSQHASAVPRQPVGVVKQAA